MVKTVKPPLRNPFAKIAPAGTTVVRDAKTGKSVTVKGVGALKGNELKIKEGLSLSKPIARQALAPPSEKRNFG